MGKEIIICTNIIMCTEIIYNEYWNYNGAEIF